MEKNKGIFIAEMMASTKLVSLLRNATQATKIENGMVVELDELVGGEADLYKVKKPEAGAKEIYLVDGVELGAEEGMTIGLDNFVNQPDVPFRVRKPLAGDRFSVSKSVITGSPAVGALLEAGTDGKLVEGATEDAQAFEVVAEWVFSGRAIDMVRLEAK